MKKKQQPKAPLKTTRKSIVPNNLNAILLALIILVALGSILAYALIINSSTIATVEGFGSKMMLSPVDIQGVLLRYPQISGEEVQVALTRLGALQLYAKSQGIHVDEKETLDQLAYDMSMLRTQEEEAVLKATAANHALVQKTLMSQMAKPTKEELMREFTEANKTLPTTYKLRILLLCSAQDQYCEVNRTQEETLAIAQKASDEKDVSKYISYSNDPKSKANDGVIGPYALSMFDQQLAQKIAELSVGQVSEPIKHTYGYYVFEILEIVPEHKATFEELEVALNFTFNSREATRVKQSWMPGIISQVSFLVKNQKEYDALIS